MVRLGKVIELHFCAHKLVADDPKSAICWFAVGCYYMLTKKYNQARQYFIKSKNYDKNFGPAWIGIGNAFAVQDESEQALATYRSASRLFLGSHIPFLSMGVEYMRTSNFSLGN